MLGRFAPILIGKNVPGTFCLVVPPAGGVTIVGNLQKTVAFRTTISCRCTRRLSFRCTRPSRCQTIRQLTPSYQPWIRPSSESHPVLASAARPGERAFGEHCSRHRDAAIIRHFNHRLNLLPQCETRWDASARTIMRACCDQQTCKASTVGGSGTDASRVQTRRRKQRAGVCTDQTIAIGA